MGLSQQKWVYERLFKVNIPQVIIMSWLICCFTLLTPDESCAKSGIEPEQANVMASQSLEDRSHNDAGADKWFEFSLDAGYRKDNLSWNESGPSVNVQSELKWENLEIAQISAGVRFNFYADWYLRDIMDVGSINSGSNQDADYNGNNRTLEFSRSNNKGGGEVRDASIELGRSFRFLNQSETNILSFAPLLGLSIHQQHLTMTEGFQTLPATGPYPGLNNSYDAQWQGPWLGIEAQLATSGSWSLNARAEYHWADYAAQANWNLRPEYSHPVSFTHTAKGMGILLSAGATYLISKNFSLNFSLKVQQWTTGSGIDQTFFIDGSVGTYTLNGVHWESTACTLGISHYF